MKEILLGLIGRFFNRKITLFFLRKFWNVKNIDYAFIVHSRGYDDFFRKFPKFKFLPIFIVKLFLRFLWPIPVCKIKGLIDKNNKNVVGAFFAIPSEAKYLLDNRDIALKKIENVTRLALKCGAQYIGLGALTASLSGNGKKLTGIQNRNNIIITTGHSYTTWNITRNVYDIISLLNKNINDLTLAIVGAAGSIGNSCYEVLKDDFKKIILIDKRFLEEINSKGIDRVSYSSNIEEIKNADIIITATNSPYSIINDNKLLKKDCILIDDAQPINVSKDVLHNREDVIVIEGGVAHHKNIEYNLDLDFIDRGDIFSCLAEVMILSISKRNDLSVLGKTNIKLVNELGKLGAKLGFGLGRFRGFGKIIDKLENI
jgi:fatty aldehyde-generating acyl-ACP reductase